MGCPTQSEVTFRYIDGFSKMNSDMDRGDITLSFGVRFIVIACSMPILWPVEKG